MKRLTLALFLFCSAGSFALAAVPQTPEEVLHGANQDMDNGHYDQAAQGYRSLLDQGMENGSIHGNLGQALFRQGKLGEALFQSLLAARLKPRDPDLEANLASLRGRATDRIEPRHRNLAVRILQNVSGRMNRRENWFGFMGLWFGFWSVAAARLYWKKDLLRWSSWIVGAGLFLMAASLIQKEFLERPIGVVVSPEAKVYSGPGEANVLLFELHEGAEVSVLPREESGWIPIELADGKKGWVKGDHLVTN
jgi:tetratricopeptide (TPR) repeat protein